MCQTRKQQVHIGGRIFRRVKGEREHKAAPSLHIQGEVIFPLLKHGLQAVGLRLLRQRIVLIDIECFDQGSRKAGP